VTGVSAYAIGTKVWLVATDKTAQEEVPQTLPIGSFMLTEEEAKALTRQMGMARAKVRFRLKRDAA